MTRSRLFLCTIIVGFAACVSALAEEAYTSKDANLRAGPSRDYPLVTQIPEGTSVEVAGCLNDFAWCDVIAGQDRGWMYSGNLEYPYEGRRVAILQEGPAIGLPTVTFSVGSYWDNYYRGRPFYGRRSYFSARPFPQPRAWVRPTGSRVFRSPGVNRSYSNRGNQPSRGSQRDAGRNPSDRSPQGNSGPRVVAPRPAVQPHPQVQRSRPVEQRPAQAQRPEQHPQGQRPGQGQPQNRKQPDRGRPQDKKDRPGPN